MIRIPDWLRYEMHHRIERLSERFRGWRGRQWINGNPRTIAILAVTSVLLLTLVFIMVRRSPADRRDVQGKTAWFYDSNTGELFVADGKDLGPIEAPSGPLPEGGRAGFRAHVYSYVLDPNESELFVGFLQQPDPDAGGSGSADSDWAEGTLIRRVDDRAPCPWVSAESPEGRRIVEGLTRPNHRGQSPIYQLPKSR